MVSSVRKVVKDEVNNVCKHHETLLKKVNVTKSEDLINFDWKDVVESMNMKLPALMGVLNSITENNNNSNVSRLSTAVSVLFYNRNQNRNLLQSVIDIVIDSCGVTKKVCSIFTLTIQRIHIELELF